jgi:N-terminal acetyltransferase B complex catalytic subunit
MTTLRQFRSTDLFRFNHVNVDHLTETFSMYFYHSYLAKWPGLFIAAQAPNLDVAGYMIGKVEGKGAHWHGHVSAVTVAPAYRRLGLAKLLMDILEELSDSPHKGNFVDLYVRASNFVAVSMYKKLGYVVYRRILNYYSGEEDAYDMRKALLRQDPERRSEIPKLAPSQPGELDTM